MYGRQESAQGRRCKKFTLVVAAALGNTYTFTYRVMISAHTVLILLSRRPQHRKVERTKLKLSCDAPAVALFRVSSVKRQLIRNEMQDPRLNVMACSRISTTHGRRFLIPTKLSTFRTLPTLPLGFPQDHAYIHRDLHSMSR